MIKSRPYKILALSYLFPNRVHRNYGVFVLNRLKAVNKHVSVHVINPIPWSPIHRFLPRYSKYNTIPLKDEIDGLTIYHPRFLSIPKFFKFIEAYSYKRAVRKVLMLEKGLLGYDIVDMHWTFPDIIAGVNLCKEYNLPSILTIRGREAFHIDEGNYQEHSVSKNIPKITRIISLSNELKDISIKKSGKNNVNVIRNGVDTDRFYYIEKAASTIKQTINSKEIVILIVGSLNYGKGFDLIISALAELRYKTDLNIKLYIIGSHGPAGDNRKELHSLIQSLDIEPYVEFVGEVLNKDLVHWYNSSDLFCLASRSEGSPNVLTEALACGCPSLTTDVGSAREIIEIKDGLGICIEKHDAILIEHAILKILNTKYDRKDNSLFYSKFNWEWCGEQVVTIYDDVLSGDKSCVLNNE